MRMLLLAVTVLLAQTANPIPAGSISGKIIALNGGPAANARVQALLALEDSGASANAIFVFALTDANGGYRLENVPPGRYYVAVGGVESPTYFPGVAAVKEATAVSIRAGDNLSGFDFKMVIPQPLKISGRVYGPGRNIVRLAGPRSQIAQSDLDGSFQFSNLVPGDYEITIGLSNAAPVPIRITLVDRDITNVDFGTPPGSIAVNVTVERGGPLPQFQLLFVSDNSGNANLPSTRTSSYRVVPGLGVYLLPGKYRISVSGLPDGYTEKSIQANQTEFSGGAALDVVSKDSIGLTISLAVSNPPPWVNVRGTVTGPKRESIRTVELNGPALPAAVSASVGSDGSFEFPMILAGTYSIRPSPSSGYFPRTIVVAHDNVIGVEVSPPTNKDLVGDFVAISPGEFMMGCSPGDRDCLPEEQPSHKVRITRGFEIGRFEVTQLQWESLMSANPSQFKGETLPVENINTWSMVENFLGKLNSLNDGFQYRVPTEAEWEYAARAGSTGPTFAPLGTIAWYGENSMNLQAGLRVLGGPTPTPTHPGGQLLPNAWGLFDMQGNVWEWTSDWYSADYYKVSPEADPKGPESGPMRVMKGGSADVAPQIVRVSIRGNQPPVDPSYFFGIRLVRESRR